MEVQPTPDQKAFIRNAIETGRLQSEQDAMQEGLALWEERERVRVETSLLIQDSEVSLANGKGRVITPESLLQMAEGVRQRGRARLAAEASASI